MLLVVEAAMQAQADGYDGVYLGGWNDPLWEAREMLDIPVASVGEQSMLAALAIERDIIAYGLRDRCIARPVRSITPYSDAQLLLEAVDAPARQFIPRFEAAAHACISEGADVICSSCRQAASCNHGEPGTTQRLMTRPGGRCYR